MTQDQVENTLRTAGLLGTGEHAVIEPLTGGVSSLILRVDLPDGRQVCLKKALPKLKVADHWVADPARNAAERASLKVHSEIVPESTPKILFEDPDEQLFVMEYLGQAHTWKVDLMSGKVDPAPAAKAGRVLGLVHSHTVDRPGLEELFANHGLFDQLRIDPYLRVIGTRHPDIGEAIGAMIKSIDEHRECLVHGDFSPKNILITGDGRLILLDHEVAVFSDPAFDVAFLLSHLFLKGIYSPPSIPGLVESAEEFRTAYRDITRLTLSADLEDRITRLLPMLMLARVDGKSPVEYLDEAQRGNTRTFAKKQIISVSQTVDEFSERFEAAFMK
jgi:tRNA A-37 threonylcarbamoyl transferase component Bud32